MKLIMYLVPFPSARVGLGGDKWSSYFMHVLNQESDGLVFTFVDK